MNKRIDEIRDVLKHTESVYCRLSGVGDYPLCPTKELDDLLGEIESLQAQLKDVTATLGQTWEWDMYKCANREIDRLRRELAASRRREQAAVEDLRDAATTSEKICKWCRFRGDHHYCQSCGWHTGWIENDWKTDKWQWRGPQEKGDTE
jgi:hypothetical protein